MDYFAHILRVATPVELSGGSSKIIASVRPAQGSLSLIVAEPTQKVR